MATERTLGGNGQLFIGEDKTLRFELVGDGSVDPLGVPVDAHAWTIRFDVRKTDAARTFVLDKLATVVGTFNVDRALNTQRAVVQLDDTDTNKFKPRVYRYSLKRMDEGIETVLFFGDFAPQKASAP